jgi:YVTN family beta-propeller protein
MTRGAYLVKLTSHALRRLAAAAITCTAILLPAAALPAAALPAAALASAGGPAATAGSPASRARQAHPVTAYVTNSGSDTVTPIDTATGKAGKAIKVGKGPAAIAIAPNGRPPTSSTVAMAFPRAG